MGRRATHGPVVSGVAAMSPSVSRTPTWTGGAAVAALIGLAIWVLSALLKPLLWAAILAYATWPAFRLLRKCLGERATLGALLATFGIGLMLAVPLLALVGIVHHELLNVVESLPRWLDSKPLLPEFLSEIPFFSTELERIHGEFDDLQTLLRDHLLPRLGGVSKGLLAAVGSLSQGLIRAALMLLFLFFFYQNGPTVARWLRQSLVAVLGSRGDGAIARIEQTLRALVYGIALTAIVQGSVAGVGYWLVGLSAPALLTALSILLAVVPFGIVLVWGSASISLFLQGDTAHGIALTLWGLLLVSWIDNLVRPWFISRESRIPFAVILAGLLGGLSAFGLIGLFIGPLSLALLLVTWQEWLFPHTAPDDPPTGTQAPPAETPPP